MFGQGVFLFPVFLTMAGKMEMTIFCNLERYGYIKETERSAYKIKLKVDQ